MPVVTYTLSEADVKTLQESFVLAEAAVSASTDETLKKRFRHLKKMIEAKDAPPDRPHREHIH
jgi:hypothetical protein